MYVGHDGGGADHRYVAATEDYVYLAQRLYIVTSILDREVATGRCLNLRKPGGFVLCRTGRLLLVALHSDPESPGLVLHAIRTLRRQLEEEGF